jgi:Restriction Endonuclease associating with ARP
MSNKLGDFRHLFAYSSPMERTASALRREISHRNAARTAAWPAELSYSPVPSIVYAETPTGGHGNFLPSAYKRILQNPDWRARLAKVYTGSRFFPRQADRTRHELECANSSDALLMNIFCYPGVTRRPALCSLLGVEPGLRPAFGFRPGIPLSKGAQDRSELDLKLGNLLIEAKLTEGDFQTARRGLVGRYRDLETVFEVDQLPVTNDKFRSCQVIRGALAAHAHQASFVVFCDQRRPDLIEDCFKIMTAVTSSELRCRMSVVTWQELAGTLPPKVQTFLAEKYGISFFGSSQGRLRGRNPLYR